jgi:hypothetical protein
VEPIGTVACDQRVIASMDGVIPTVLVQQDLMPSLSVYQWLRRRRSQAALRGSAEIWPKECKLLLTIWMAEQSGTRLEIDDARWAHAQQTSQGRLCGTKQVDRARRGDCHWRCLCQTVSDTHTHVLRFVT